MKVTVELGRALGGDDDIRYRAGSQMGTPALEEPPSPPFSTRPSSSEFGSAEICMKRMAD